MADGRFLEMSLAPGWSQPGDARLQIGIEHLVGIELRAVRGQVEHFDLVPLLNFEWVMLAGQGRA
ncbi:hypothetical protein WJ09_18820 [Burkholderia vietnamiensis]|nr:hypothetical protein WJ09_18820 [Burkholderia vietnamiensis]